MISPLPRPHSTDSRLQMAEVILDDIVKRLRKANAQELAARGASLLEAVCGVKDLPQGNEQRAQVLTEAMEFQREMRQLLVNVRKDQKKRY